MSTLTSRLNRDEEGVVASAELILALPIFLLFWVMLWDFGLVQTARVVLAVENRTAAFLEANHRNCTVFGNHQIAVGDKTTFEQSRCTRQAWPGAARFWNEMDRAGGSDLVRDVARARAPDLVTANKVAAFRFHPELNWDVYRMPDKLVVMEPLTFTNDDPALAIGYDPTLKRRLSSGHGSLMDLFPNLFPRAR